MSRDSLEIRACRLQFVAAITLALHNASLVRDYVKNKEQEGNVNMYRNVTSVCALNRGDRCFFRPRLFLALVTNTPIERRRLPVAIIAVADTLALVATIVGCGIA